MPNAHEELQEVPDIDPTDDADDSNRCFSAGLIKYEADKRAQAHSSGLSEFEERLRLARRDAESSPDRPAGNRRRMPTPTVVTRMLEEPQPSRQSLPRR